MTDHVGDANKMVGAKPLSDEELKQNPSPHIKIENPGKPWSPCWLDEGKDYCPICKKHREESETIDGKHN